MDGYMVGLVQWPEVFEKATGQKLAFMDVDVGWILPWTDIVGRFASEMKRRGIKFGLIYNGIDTDLSGETWVQNAIEHFESYENSGYPAPDAAIIQSWVQFPTHVLPETDSGSLTYVLRRYVEPKPIITAARSTQEISGSVVSGGGKTPIVDATVSLLSEYRLGEPEPSPHEIQGIVPTGAEFAIMSIRMNTECACDTNADVDISTLAFRQTSGGVTYEAPLRGWTFSGENQRSAGNNESTSPEFRIRSMISKEFRADSPRFRVYADQPFQFSALYSLKSANEGGGLIVLRFLDASGKEIKRTYILFEKTWHLVSKTKTDLQGRFRITADGIDTTSQVYKLQTRMIGPSRESIFYLQ